MGFYRFVQLDCEFNVVVSHIFVLEKSKSIIHILEPNSRLTDVLHHPFFFKITQENVLQNRTKWGAHCDAINLVIVLAIKNKMTLLCLSGTNAKNPNSILT